VSSPESRETARERERIVDELYGHWRGGARTEALGAARKWLESRRHAFDEYGWLCDRLLAWPDRRLAHRLAQDCITRLIESRRTAQALIQARRHLQSAPVRPRPLPAGGWSPRPDIGTALARLLLADFGVTIRRPRNADRPAANSAQRDVPEIN
jgi:hypothetical protein